MRNGELVVEGTYKVKEDRLEVTDENGPMACGGDQKTGKYKWKLEDKMLSFTRVEDESDGRSKGLTGTTWMLEK